MVPPAWLRRTMSAIRSQAEVADNFMGDGADVVGVGWWGVYWNGTPLPPDGFNIRIYADNGGLPGDLLYEETAATYNETAGDPYGYCANLAAPFAKADGVGYHLSVQAQFCFPPQWGYSSGDGDGLQASFKSAFFRLSGLRAGDDAVRRPVRRCVPPLQWMVVAEPSRPRMRPGPRSRVCTGNPVQST